MVKRNEAGPDGACSEPFGTGERLLPAGDPDVSDLGGPVRGCWSWLPGFGREGFLMLILQMERLRPGRERRHEALGHWGVGLRTRL